MRGRPAHTPIWLGDLESAHHPSLSGGRRADVVVVGAGITGLSTALLLQQAGLTVAVLEAWRVGGGGSGATSGHLSALPDGSLADLERRFGGEVARQAYSTGALAIDRIEAFCRELRVDADFARIPGYLWAEGPREEAALEAVGATARRLSLPLTRLRAEGLPGRLALRLDDQARIHPVRYLQALARALHERGGRVHEFSRALTIDPGNPCIVATPEGEVTADHVVLATHGPVGLAPLGPSPVAAHRSYCVAMTQEGPFPDALLWGMDAPYHHVRRHRDRLIVGGEDHRVGPRNDLVPRFEALERWARDRLPVGEVTHRWSGQVYEPTDGLPSIGRVPGSRSVLAASGFAGAGLTFGTASAMLLAELIQGRSHPWEALYAPRPAVGAPEAEDLGASEDAWRFVQDRLSPAEVQAIDRVPRGAGRVIDVGGSRIAAYRDQGGALHLMSALCPHAGGVVQWNEVEHRWDCPLHGERTHDLEHRAQGPQRRAEEEPEPTS